MKRIKFTAQGANSLIGGFSSGDIMRVDDALAEHLVKEALVAKYIETEADLATEKAATKARKPKKPDPLLAEIAELEAKVKGNPNSDQAAEPQALLDAKRAELAAK